MTNRRMGLFVSAAAALLYCVAVISIVVLNG
jgi:hypothetical protein